MQAYSKDSSERTDYLVEGFTSFIKPVNSIETRIFIYQSVQIKHKYSECMKASSGNDSSIIPERHKTCFIIEKIDGEVVH